MIGNSPMPNAERPQEQPLRTTGEWLGESLSPIRAMLNAREARSDESVRRMQAAVLLAGETAKGRAPETMTAQWAEFRLVNYKDRPLPLGWLLSAQSRGEMSRQLAFETGDCFKGYPLARVAENHNFCSLREVVTVLRAMRKRD